jgi:predicted HicB family RNase H-like nuclease
MKTYPMLSFRCDSKLLKALQRQAKHQDISIGELIREACTNHLECLKETVNE